MTRSDDREQRRRTPASGVKVGEEDEVVDTVRLGRYARDTQQTVLRTGDRVEGLRAEVTARLDRVDDRIDKMDGQLDKLSETSASVVGKLDILVDEMRADRAIRISAVQATIDVNRSSQIAAIEDKRDEAGWRRKVSLRLVAGVASPALLAAIGTWFLSRC